MISNVKFTLFERIQAMIPFDNKEMHKMLKLYTLNTDGYGLLYSIMRQSLPWMTTNKGGWCSKPWDSSKSASEYATIVITQANNLAIEIGQVKIEYDKSNNVKF